MYNYIHIYVCVYIYICLICVYDKLRQVIILKND